MTGNLLVAHTKCIRKVYKV